MCLGCFALFERYEKTNIKGKTEVTCHLSINIIEANVDAVIRYNLTWKVKCSLFLKKKTIKK